MHTSKVFDSCNLEETIVLLNPHLERTSIVLAKFVVFSPTDSARCLY